MSARRISDLRLKRVGLKWPEIMLFGDSLTQFGFAPEGGWVTLVADMLQRRCDVINRGLSGYNSRWARLVLPRLIAPSAELDSEPRHPLNALPHSVVLFFGANDSALEKLNKRQHVPLEEYKDNLKSMVEYLLNQGVRRDRILLLDNPPVDEQKWAEALREKGGVLDRTTEVSGQYAHACVEVAQKLGVGSIGLYDAMMAHQDWPALLRDGLHLSATGGQFVFQTVRPWLEQTTLDLPVLLPLWSDVDPDNPTADLAGRP